MARVSKFLGAAAFIGAFALVRHGDDFLRRMDFYWLVHNSTASGRIGGPIADAIPKAAEDCPPDGRPVRRIELTPEQAEIIFGPPSERKQAEPAASRKCRPRKVITLTPEQWKAFMSPEDWERAFATKTAEPQETQP
ncbi:hypothetical protein [Paracoccus sp. IB05]|uniref:hypothetical protein n=1 Tax=Paracoccus sp. IB05 TaxID=2779367 RepID=UPI0018E7608A|nr:hypothetical protein [Paracoccus sp. IB05]MBJ2154099.1 hypothetical protein [Paracoccus sp. IB05]